MGDSGYIYIPASCAANQTCGLHTAFHGCNQDLETIGEIFVRNAGLNEWADTNNLVILYPQVSESPYFHNLFACFALSFDFSHS